MSAGEIVRKFYEAAQRKDLAAEWHQVRNGKIARVQSAFDGRPWAALFAAR